MEHGKFCMCSSCLVALARGNEPKRCPFHVYSDASSRGGQAVVMGRCELPDGHRGEHVNTEAERIAADHRNADVSTRPTVKP